MQPGSDRLFDEMIDAQGAIRPAYAGFCEWYDRQDPVWLRRQSAEAERFFRRTGITFNVYGNDAGEERLIPLRYDPPDCLGTRMAAAVPRDRAAGESIERFPP